MRRERWLAVMVLVPALSMAQTESKSEKQRRLLEQQLGLPNTPSAPVDAGAPTREPEPTEAATPADADEEAVRVAAAGPSWSDGASAVLDQSCAGCHRVGAPAATSGWTLGAGARADYAATVRLVSVSSPAQSTLLKKARGEARHSGGKVLTKASPGHGVLLKWIAGGATFGRAAAAAPAAEIVKPIVPAAPVAAAPLEATPDAGIGAAAPSPELLFAPAIHDALLASCSSCHSPGNAAAASRYLASPDPVAHAAAALALVVPGSAATSLLFQCARGDAHPAGAVWPADSPQLAALGAWIDSGAQVAAAADTGVSEAPRTDGGTPTAPLTGAAAVVDAVVHAHERGGLSLGSYPVIGALRLNGRFDLNLERRHYTDNPFASEATNALASYHHFLFLNRQSTEDNFTLNVEVLTLLFWEVGYRISRDDWPVRLTAKFGKLIVPFGGEWLHHSYGGLAGFDSKVLPAVFAQEGVLLSAETRVQQVAFTADVYMISGYGLKRADGVLNLQNDFAPLDTLRPAFGGRVGASWGPISVHYSGLVNTLGYGRQLYLQALDLAVWRPRGVPVLQHFSFGAGVLRADVSGGERGFGGPGDDYYHFATYWQVRYHPFDWLFVQYRQGLRTFDNRRGVILDDTRLSADDASAHNVSIVARWRGASVGLSQFWNLEKADEQPNDFTRLMVSYDF